MKIIAIDLTYNPFGGSHTQIKSMFENIDEYPNKKFIVYITHQNYDLFKDYENKRISFIKVLLPSYSKITRLIWTQIFLPFRLIFDSIDLLFCPGNFSPILSFTNKIQLIGTIGPFEKGFYKDFSTSEKCILMINKYLMIFSSLTSQKVIFLSNYTRDLFVERFRFNISKSEVIHLGRDDYFHAINLTESDQNDQYILSVSHLYPYKNIETLLRAFKDIPDQNIILKIAGSFQSEKYKKKLIQLTKELSIEERVFFLGSVNKKTLRELYSASKMLVFTSPYENYAHILIEAMSCGSPIVSSNSTAMPETCNEAALYFDPESSYQLTEIMKNLLSDSNLEMEYRNRSLIRSSELDSHSDVNRKTNQLIEMV